MNDFSLSAAGSSNVGGYIQDLYGGMPAPPHEVVTTEVHALTTPTHRLQIYSVRVSAPWTLEWHLTLLTPLSALAKNGPVLLSPDGCWPHVVSTEAMSAVLEQGVGLAYFDRLYLAHDRPDGRRTGALKPKPGDAWGAISAWAWGLKTSVQALRQLSEFEFSKIGVMGHSRGGKAALLAGALDPDIALTITHNSGCAGAASFQVRDDSAETLDSMQHHFPHWLSLECKQASVRKDLEGRDNAALLECFTGRHLCVMQAEDDLWANPSGTRHAVERLRAHWQTLGLSDHLTHFIRTGGHRMTGMDWSRAAQTLAKIHSQNQAQKD